MGHRMMGNGSDHTVANLLKSSGMDGGADLRPGDASGFGSTNGHGFAAAKEADVFSGDRRGARN